MKSVLPGLAKTKPNASAGCKCYSATAQEVADELELESDAPNAGDDLRLPSPPAAHPSLLEGTVT